MKVDKTKPIGDHGHLLEIGAATWNAEDVSVRNRYPTKTGGFSPRSSSEIPLGDIREIVTFVADEDCLSASDCIAMAQALLASAARTIKP